MQQRQTAPMDPLMAAVHARFGSRLLACLYYGSTRRLADPRGGLVDLYAVVDHYRGTWRSPLTGLANWLLPPNVIYLETPDGLRAKCAVVRVDQFRRQMTALHPYFWGRFSQPFALVYWRTGLDRQLMEMCQWLAVMQFLRASTALMAPATPFTAETLWRTGLAASYHSELRAERHTRLDQLAQQDCADWATLTQLAAPLLGLEPQADGQWLSPLDPEAVVAEQRRWRWRRRVGVVLSLLRLMKAVFTFENAVDYGLWKIARHTGEPLVVSARVKRWPLIFGWPVLWRLYRRGLLR